MAKKPRKISLIGSRATSVLSVALVLIIIGLCATLGLAIHRATASVSEETTILVTIVPDEDPLRVSEIKREFNSAPWISKYEYTDAKTVLAREVETMDESTREGLELLARNPFGDEFMIYPAEAWRNPDSIAVLSERLRGIKSVDIVSGDISAVQQSSDGLGRMILYLSIFALILLVISIALINNTISLSIYSRRFTIHTMKLVGATNSFIRRPFVRAGMWSGVIAGLIAAMTVCGIQAYLIFNDTFVGPWLQMSDIGFTAGGLIILGAVIARASAWCSATNYLHKSYDAMFKK